MTEQGNNRKRPRMTRRGFVGAMGGAATLAAFQSSRSQSAAASENYYFQDSFGKAVPVDRSLIDRGLYPPDVPDSGAAPNAGSNYYSVGYPQYNILLILVDQMRNPSFWLPSGSNWMNTYANAMPNITSLAKRNAFLFPNYFVAATACTPSRACLLTGLYSQQTCVFQTGTPGIVPPPLLPWNESWSPGGPAGFPTIGNVLSQSFNGQNGYNCTWIGKWHLSCQSGEQDGVPGANGPSDYGFASEWNIPTASDTNPYPAGQNAGRGYPSPNGGVNEGSGGDFLDSFTQRIPAHDSPGFGWNNITSPLKYAGKPAAPTPLFTQLNDAAIAHAFTNYWLPYAANNLNGGTGSNSQLLTPWFCAVSFVNPHDITEFPWNSGLVSSGNNNQFTFASNNLVPGAAFQPAPVNTSADHPYSGSYVGSDPGSDSVLIRKFPFFYSSPPPGAGNNGPWNYEESLAGKPAAQTAFQTTLNQITGVVQSPGYNSSNNTYATPQAWDTFLNYYAWLQSCVDYQVGQVLGTNVGGASGLAQSVFNNNTLVIFTSDHGEYGGSHGLHAKAGALYDESLNVPLIVSFPSLRNANNSANNGVPTVLPYVCSSVDLLPFLYTLALGNELWRNNSSDIIYHLAGRESIFDAIYYHNNSQSYWPWPGVQHRRISGIPLHNNTTGSSDWQLYQPFVLHTTDEFPVISVGGAPQPSHAVAFRTLDQTEATTSAAPFFGQVSYGGGKLGVYSFWDTTTPTNAPIKGIPANKSLSVQYEFYNYSPSRNNNNANRGEVGNETDYTGASVSALAAPYVKDFANIGNNNGIAVADELYLLNTGGSNSNNIQQVQAAIQTAFNNYITYLKCVDQMTGPHGLPTGKLGNNCPAQFNS
jgi:arylsulfatase A-like enzyme